MGSGDPSTAPPPAGGRATLKDRLLGGRLRHLRSLVEFDVGGGILQQEDLQGLLGGHSGSELLLGRFSARDIEEGFVRHGITQRLQAMGLAPFELRVDARDPYRHTLQVFTLGDRRDLLAESSLRVGQFQTDAEWAGPLQGKRLRMLYVLWLLMQNPRADFVPERPALPGQEHAGLRVARQVDRLFRRLAERLDCHGIINCPEFFHTAVFYSSAYHFLAASAEGQLQALRRDLVSLDLARASWAVLKGCVLHADGPAAGQVFHWEPQEQLLPQHPTLAAYFVSPAYSDAVAEAAQRCRFTIDHERFAAVDPVRPDGSVAEADRVG